MLFYLDVYADEVGVVKHLGVMSQLYASLPKVLCKREPVGSHLIPVAQT